MEEALAGLLAIAIVCLFFSYCQKLEDNKKLPSKPPVVQPNAQGEAQPPAKNL